MLGRFSPLELFRGQRKTLSNYSSVRPVPDRWARGVLYIGPVLVGAAMFIFGGTFAAPGSILTGVALLAGGFLSAFTHLSTLRLRLTEREDEWAVTERPDRDAFDETATHLLTATYTAGLTALLLILGMNFSMDEHGRLTGWMAALVSIPGSYLFLVFAIAIPKLYNAYATLNRVRDELSGTFKD